MSVDQKVVMESLISQRKEVNDAIIELQNRLESARAQFLKLTGAIEVLEEINKEESSDTPDETDVEPAE